jgi:pSer/pThr/pTyr-binding forkhead associated (FHA) protein
MAEEGRALMWTLQLSDPSKAPLVFRIKPGGIKTIGRAPRADFIVDAALVSRLHCRLEAGDDVVDVVDLSSTNGTFINDERIKRGRLKNGDRLRVGRVELKLEKIENVGI